MCAAKRVLGLWGPTLIALLSTATAVHADRCESPVARIVEALGPVEVVRVDGSGWRAVSRDDPICPGDRVRVGPLGRAAVQLSDEAATPIRLDERTVLTFPAPQADKSLLLELLEGVIHVLSRIPHILTVETPLASAGIEGTEFVLGVKKTEADLWVFEGRVRYWNAQGELLVGSGEGALAHPGQAPVRRVVVKPREAVEWALYYPPLVDARPAAFPPALRAAVSASRGNDLAGAFAALERVPAADRDARYFLLRAGLLLGVGRVPQAEADLTEAERADPRSGGISALRSVIALVRDQKDEALWLAENGAGLDPGSPLPEAALSYAYQGRFEIEKALAHARRAVELAPEDALLWARVSELELSLGDLDAALTAAQKAESLNPTLSRTQTVLGYAYLTRIETDRARSAFERAIEGDPADPLPRLGMGLAKIRDGDLDEGTREIETAASLDPDNSLVRSYLGKAYYEQKRDGLAAGEYQRAKDLDPLDPTPWFYDAIRKQTTNRPVEALHDLQRAIDLNGNRAVYRSKLLLDQDLAARSANLARIYDDLGFQERARVEAWKSVIADPASFSAHRFLADSYGTLQRHEIARVSELLQSQLLQPISLTPLQPELAIADLAILQGAGPSSLSFYEYNPLFTRNGIGLQTNVLVGNNDTVADDFVVSGIHGRFSGSLGQFHYQTDGFRPNNDLDNDVYNAFAQVAVTPELSLQAELRRREQEAGDVDLKLGDPDRSFRQQIEQDVARLGARYQPSGRHDLLASFIYSDSEFTTDRNIDFFADSIDDIASHEVNPVEGYTAEVQHLFRGQRFKAISGIGYTRLRDRTVAIERALPGGKEPPLPPDDSVDHREDIHAYSYVPISLGATATVTLGASYDSFHTAERDTHPINPKLGLVWNVLPSTTLRAAAFRVLKRFFVTDQTLEPTHLAGFNQFFDDLDGTVSTRYGFGLDQRFSPDLYGGFELSWRDISRTYTDRTEEGQDERLYRGYVHWAPHARVALAGEYQFETFERQSVLGFEGREFLDLPELRTHYLPLDVSYFHPSGLSASFGATYVDQKATTVDLKTSNDRFWTLDASIGYRLPKRYGLVSLDVRNLLDERFDYQNSFNEGAQQLPRFQSSRAVFLRINLWTF